MGLCTSATKIYTCDNNIEGPVMDNNYTEYVEYSLDTHTYSRPYETFLNMCKYGPEDICIEYLENHPQECTMYLGTWNLCFNDACEHNMDRVCIKMLELYPKCVQSRALFGDTPLIITCLHTKDELCLKILDILQGRDLDSVNHYGFTALMYACKNNMVTVCEQILRFPTKCKLNHKNTHGESALTYARKNCMHSIVKLILQHTPEDEVKQLINNYMKDPVLLLLNDRKCTSILNLEEISNKITFVKKYNEELHKSCKGNDCTICFEETTHSYYLNCHHSIRICDSCINQSKLKTCPVCRERITLIERTYIVQ